MDESDKSALERRQRPAKVAMRSLIVLAAAVVFLQSRALIPPQFIEIFAIFYLLAFLAIIAFVVWTRLSRRRNSTS